MKKEVRLPRDEMLHENQAIEWWYFNGFLEGKKNKYSFMTCLFKAEKDKVNLKFLKVPFKTVYFSHSLLYNLTEKKVEKEILPVVLVSTDSFKHPDLFINYFYPLRKDFFNYEISRHDDKLRIKTRFFDLLAKEMKKPLLVGGKGFIDFGEKSTYYYTYPCLEVKGLLNGEKVHGKAWHDKQWSDKGFMKDSWLWFSLQFNNNMQIVCFDYKGKKMATISYPNGKQETCDVKFSPLKNVWKSPTSEVKYNLSWEIRIKDMIIKTKPIIEDCEMNFGFLNYWEGPIELYFNGKKSFGFMEHLAEQRSTMFGMIKNEQQKIFKNIRNYFS